MSNLFNQEDQKFLREKYFSVLKENNTQLKRIADLLESIRPVTLATQKLEPGDSPAQSTPKISSKSVETPTETKAPPKPVEPSTGTKASKSTSKTKSSRKNNDTTKVGEPAATG